MQTARPVPCIVQAVCKPTRKRASNCIRSLNSRNFSSRARLSRNFISKQKTLSCFFALGTGIFFFSETAGFSKLYADSSPPSVDFQIEKTSKRTNLSKEENRNSISSQHAQVRRSWENPGVYAWGSNSGRVVAPDSDENIVKLPRRIPFFDGVLLRDIKLDRDFGAAILENGDLLQWGTRFSPNARAPVATLRGKGLVACEISRDRIIALSSSGNVYSLPVSQSDQSAGPKPEESSWIPFLSHSSPISYRILQPSSLSNSEKVTSISSGLEHVLLLTNNGRVFSAASSSEEYPSRGQMGISGLTWTTRPQGRYDDPHEISTLRGFEISTIATGDYHSLALDREGRIFAFGDNTSGQLGFEPAADSPFIDTPSLLPTQRLYNGTSLSARVTSIAAGGSNSYFTVDATRVARPNEDTTAPGVGLGRVVADTWSCGLGLHGGLGTGRWTHIQGTPVKLKALSGLYEYDEIAKRVVPIRLKRLSVGSTQASATMDNVTHVHAGTSAGVDSENDTNWGADVLWWGGNEFWQLGMGKRSNVALPGYIAPLDRAADAVAKGRKKEEKQHRFQITPRHTVSLQGRKVSMEQRVECGRGLSAVYSAV